MTKKNEPAFPRLELPHMHVDPAHVVSGGLTKREYFVALAMQSILSAHPQDRWVTLTTSEMNVAKWVAHNAIVIADIVLDELEKKK
jgi:hypothetical protein